MSNLVTPVLSTLLAALEVMVLLTTLIITMTDSVKHIIIAYQVQSFILALVCMLTAGLKATIDLNVAVIIFFIVVLPLSQALFIRGLLVRATMSSRDQEKPVALSLSVLIRQLIGWLLPPAALIQQAEREWVKPQRAKSAPWDVVVFLVLMGFAVIIASQTPPTAFQLPDKIGLAISLSLHLVGLYNMVVKRDIISQIIGLLLMDHGLYLAVVKIVQIPVPATFFVISLYFYTLITLFILVVLLPRVRSNLGTIGLDRIARESNLKG